MNSVRRVVSLVIKVLYKGNIGIFYMIYKGGITNHFNTMPDVMQRGGHRFPSSNSLLADVRSWFIRVV